MYKCLVCKKKRTHSFGEMYLHQHKCNIKYNFMKFNIHTYSKKKENNLNNTLSISKLKVKQKF